MTDHPLLGTANITTSQLIAIDPEAGWARTASRWYRLGRSIDVLEAELADSMNGKKALAGSIDFTLPGFTNIDDPELLQKLLAEYITRVREIDAADTTRCPARLPARSRREKDVADPEAHTAPTFDDFASSASTAISLLSAPGR